MTNDTAVKGWPMLLDVLPFGNNLLKWRPGFNFTVFTKADEEDPIDDALDYFIERRVSPFEVRVALDQIPRESDAIIFKFGQEQSVNRALTRQSDKKPLPSLPFDRLFVETCNERLDRIAGNCFVSK